MFQRKNKENSRSDTGIFLTKQKYLYTRIHEYMSSSILASYPHLTVWYFCLDIFSKYFSKSSVSFSKLSGDFSCSVIAKNETIQVSKKIENGLLRTSQWPNYHKPIHSLLCIFTVNPNKPGKISCTIFCRIGGNFSVEISWNHFRMTHKNHPPEKADFIYLSFSYV